ncbi:MAG: hypothetical protein E6423_07025 [Clostridium sp.]|nr:hypothetical protein [Clostridium sp.]
MKKRLIILFSILFSLFLFISCSNDIEDNNKSEVEQSESLEQENNLDVSSYSVKTTNSNDISMLYTGMTLSPVITVAEVSSSPFNIEITDIDESYDIGNDGNIELINSETGDCISFTRDDKGNYKILAKLERDIEYGILLNKRLVGAVRVVEDLNSIDKEELYNDISTRLSCGLS